MHPAQGQGLSFVITLCVVVLVMALRLRGMGRARRLRLETLWIIPAIYACVMAFVFWTMPPHGLVWLWCGFAVVVGAALGWQRGKLMRISVDPQTHALNQTVSPAAMLFILAIVLVRAGARWATMALGLGHDGLIAGTDMLMAFALGFLVAQRAEMAIRARHLLAQARASISSDA